MQPHRSKTVCIAEPTINKHVAEPTINTHAAKPKPVLPGPGYNQGIMLN